MHESLKVFAKQLGKNAEKQPGWIYLLAAPVSASVRCRCLLREERS